MRARAVPVSAGSTRAARCEAVSARARCSARASESANSCPTASSRAARSRPSAALSARAADGPGRGGDAWRVRTAAAIASDSARESTTGTGSAMRRSVSAPPVTSNTAPSPAAAPPLRSLPDPATARAPPPGAVRRLSAGGRLAPRHPSGASSRRPASWTSSVPTAATASSSAAARTPRTPRRPPPPMASCARWSRASSMARADGGRRVASFSRHCMTSADRARGTSGARRCGGGGTRVSCAASVSCGERPPKGEVPVRSS